MRVMKCLASRDNWLLGCGGSWSTGVGGDSSSATLKTSGTAARVLAVEEDDGVEE